MDVTISYTTPTTHVALDAGAHAIGSVSVSNLPATQPVSGTVAISGTVPISGSVTTSGTATVSGSVSVSNFPATQPVSGTVAISGTVSTTGTTTATQGAAGGAAWKVEGVAGGVAQPMSLAALPALAAGSAAIGSVTVTSAPTTAVTIATLPALTAGAAVIGHVIADTGSTTAVTSLPSLPAGGNAIGSVTVTSAPTTAVTIAALPALAAGVAAIGSVTVTAMPTTAVTLAIAPALVASSAVIGHVIADTGSTTAVTSLPALPIGSNTIGAVTGPSAVALALASNQTTEIATLASIDGKLPALSGSRVPVVLAALPALVAGTAIIGRVDCTPTGQDWTDITPTQTLGTAGQAVLIAALASRRLRAIRFSNLHTATINVMVYNVSPTWGTTIPIDTFSITAANASARDYTPRGTDIAAGLWALCSTNTFSVAIATPANGVSFVGLMGV